jgi:hypothetical protein
LSRGIDEFDFIFVLFSSAIHNAACAARRPPNNICQCFFVCEILLIHLISILETSLVKKQAICLDASVAVLLQ